VCTVFVVSRLLSSSKRVRDGEVEESVRKMYFLALYNIFDYVNWTKLFVCCDDDRSSTVESQFCSFCAHVVKL
jgi:hypothetical protein